MDLWIRSQDGTILRKVSQVYHNGCSSLCDDDYNTLGTYKTKKRALEVLDEIQNIIKVEDYHIKDEYEKIDLFIKANILNKIVIVYEMPKE